MAPAAATTVPSLSTAPRAASAVAPAASTAGPGDYIIAVRAPAPASKPAPAASTSPDAVADVMDPSCVEIKAFKDKMHAAVDAALRYPAELKFRPTAGVTIVTYDYQDGRTENPHITQWSGDGRLDRAALKAVKDADFASIRPRIGHTHIHDAVIIVFDNSANMDKNAAEQPKKKDPAADPCGS
jgi:outer membrane biosynthesis protein TonB